MSDIFKFEGNQVRTEIGDDNEPLFCASDVARCLGYALPVKAVGDHCKGVLKRNTLTAGGMQELNFIREPDVYRLVFKSQLQGAQRFMDWIAEEVLPSIRKTGKFAMDKPPTHAEALRGWADAIDENNRLLAKSAEQTNKIKRLEPLAVVGKAHVGKKGLYSIRNAVKAMDLNGRTIGPNILFQFLRDEEILMDSPNEDKHNVPYQQYVNMGLFRLRIGQRPNKESIMVPTYTTKITNKGIQYVSARILNSERYLEITKPGIDE